MTSHFCLASSNEASQPPGSYIALHFAHLLSSSLQEFWVVLPSSCISCSCPEHRPGLEAPCSVAVALHALQHSPARTGSYFPLAMCYYLVGCFFIFFHLFNDSSCYPLASLLCPQPHSHPVFQFPNVPI